MGEKEEPEARLFTLEEQARMLEDIERVSLAAAASLLPGGRGLTLSASPGPLSPGRSPVEALAIVERLLPEMVQAGRQIARSIFSDPQPHLRAVTPPVRARRVEAGAILRAVRRGEADRRVDETVTRLTADTAENRAIHSFLSHLRRECQAIGQIADTDGEDEVSARAAACAAQLHGLSRQMFGPDLPRDSAAWRCPPTQRATVRPEYAVFFRAIARCRAGLIFDWEEFWRQMPGRELWRVYELWCLLTVLDSLRGLGWAGAPSDRGNAHLLATRLGRLTLMPCTGRESEIRLHGFGGRRLSLHYNPTFAEGRHSLSHTMQPDITLQENTHVWVLDAKFKPYALPGEEGDDINQMHAYRDGIVDAAGQRLVRRAWCLYAGQAAMPNRPHLAFGRGASAPVGALCLRPGSADTAAHLRALLADWLCLAAT